MNTVSLFRICSFNIRGLSKNDPKLQVDKLLTATKFNDLIRLLNTHLDKEEVDGLGKNNKNFMTQSLSRPSGMIVFLRKSCSFKIVCHTAITSNCLFIQLTSAFRQELEMAFVYNLNDETDKIYNLRKVLNHLGAQTC